MFPFLLGSAKAKFPFQSGFNCLWGFMKRLAGMPGPQGYPRHIKEKEPWLHKHLKGWQGLCPAAAASCLLHYCLSPALPVTIRSTSMLSLAYLSRPRSPSAQQEQQWQAARWQANHRQAACSEAVAEQNFGLVICSSLCRSKPFLVDPSLWQSSGWLHQALVSL